MTRTTLTALTVASLLALSACGGTPAEPDDGGPAADAITVSDAWLKAAGEGMTGAFGTLTNGGAEEVTVVAVETDAAATAELHETVVGDSGETVMQEVTAFTVPGDSTLVLAPGDDHIMLLGLTAPIRAGDEVTYTLLFDDDSRLDVTAPAKDFAGANETYEEDR